MQRIIHVPRRFSQHAWGGREGVIFNLCRKQLERGDLPEIHTTRAFSPVGNETWRDIPIRRYHRTESFRLSSDEAADHAGERAFSVQMLLSLLLQRNVRLFHLHTLAQIGTLVSWIARIKNLPLVVSLHENSFQPLMATAHAAARRSAAAQPNAAAQRISAEDYLPPIDQLLAKNRFLITADAVICGGLNEFDTAFSVLPHDRVYHLPNGVEVKHFSNKGREACRRRLGIGPGEFLLGCISRIDPQKNQQLILQAFQDLATSYPHLHLMISGPTASAVYLERLRGLASAHPSAARVHFVDPVEPESAAHSELFAALDAFVLASRYEAFGMVALEAWAARKPVIATQTGGLQRLIRHQETGLAFAPGDRAGLVSCIRRVMGDPVLVHSLTERAYQLVARDYSWTSVAADLETIYQLAESRKR